MFSFNDILAGLAPGQSTPMGTLGGGLLRGMNPHQVQPQAPLPGTHPLGGLGGVAGQGATPGLGSAPLGQQPMPPAAQPGLPAGGDLAAILQGLAPQGGIGGALAGFGKMFAGMQGPAGPAMPNPAALAQLLQSGIGGLY